VNFLTLAPEEELNSNIIWLIQVFIIPEMATTHSAHHILVIPD